MDTTPRVLDYPEALFACAVGAVAAVGFSFVTGSVFYLVINENTDAVFDEVGWLSTFAQLGAAFAFLAGMYWRMSAYAIPVGAFVSIGVLVAVGLAGPFDTLPSIGIFLAAIPVCALILQRSARFVGRAHEPIALRILAGLGAAAIAFVAATAVAVEALEDAGAIDILSGGDKVRDYCEYGAKSRAQLEGCLSHVTIGDVDTRFTNAADYARGELDHCRSDAGPFCEDH